MDSAPNSDSTTDGFLSKEDFQRIKQMKQLKMRLGLLKKNGDPKSTVKILIPKELSMKRVDPSKLQTGGVTVSNKQKQHKKAMPLAVAAKIAKSRLEKRKKQQLSGKNFRGKNAWK